MDIDLSAVPEEITPGTTYRIVIEAQIYATVENRAQAMDLAMHLDYFEGFKVSHTGGTEVVLFVNESHDNVVQVVEIFKEV